jgi:hypothetical protein
MSCYPNPYFPSPGEPGSGPAQHPDAARPKTVEPAAGGLTVHQAGTSPEP